MSDFFSFATLQPNCNSNPILSGPPVVITSGGGIGSTSPGIGTTTAGIGTTTAGIGTTTAGIGTTTAGIGTTTAGIGTTSVGIGTTFIIRDNCFPRRAQINVIVSPTSTSVIGFDIIDPGAGYTEAPIITIKDICNKGSGAAAVANMTDDGCGKLKIKNITLLSGGHGYLHKSDGSLCGDGFVWKEPDEGYVVRGSGIGTTAAGIGTTATGIGTTSLNGEYQVVQINRPIDLNPGDSYYPPVGPPRIITEPETVILPIQPVNPITDDQLGNSYPVVLSIENIAVLDSGFGYRPGDQILINPDNGAILEPVINSLGQIESVKVLNSGSGFNDIPEIKTNSMTGFNAQMMPIFRVNRLDENTALDIPNNAKIITIIDCVGRV